VDQSARPVLLRFDDGMEPAPALNLSGAAQTGTNLWLACDEGTYLERLTAQPSGWTFAAHRRFPLAEYLDLPGGEEEEIDIEGLDYSGGYIWLVGSHSLKRRRPKRKSSVQANFLRLADVEAGPNRPLLARIPLRHDAEAGVYELASSIAAHGDSPQLSAAQLPVKEGRNPLLESLRKDEHLRRSLKIPGKDNGFDIEGLAVRENRILIGCRGPVLRGWALILELRLAERSGKQLELAPIGPAGRIYRKHFLQLEGLGVRDLVWEGNNLLVLSGPTLDLDGHTAVFRWRDAAGRDEESLFWREELEKVFDVPYGQGEDQGTDHAEGIVLFTSEKSRRRGLLVVYDSPSAARTHSKRASVVADLFPIPPSASGSAARETGPQADQAAKNPGKRRPRNAAMAE
jgi:hypothetical protein